MNSPHFHIRRHESGSFNAVPVTRTGWVVTIGSSIILMLVSLMLIFPVITGALSIWAYLGIVLILTGVYCWGLIRFALKHGEDI